MAANRDRRYPPKSPKHYCALILFADSDRIETGQWIPGEGHLWSARIAVGE